MFLVPKIAKFYDEKASCILVTNESSPSKDALLEQGCSTLAELGQLHFIPLDY